MKRSPRLPQGFFFGDQARCVHAAGFTIGLWRATRPPEAVETHAHDDAHFVLAIDRGYLSLAHDGPRGVGRVHEAGALIWNPAGVEHRDRFETIGGRFLSVSFAAPAGAAHGEPRRLRDGPAEVAARRLVGSVASGATGDGLALENLALDLAAAALAPTDVAEDPAPDWLHRAIEAIGDLSGRAGVEVRDIASAVGVHPVSLARRYRRHHGCSPAGAIRRHRADRAAAALRRGTALVDLAALVGYADQSHMTREFRSIYGLTPAQYRRLWS